MLRPGVLDRPVVDATAEVQATSAAARGGSVRFEDATYCYPTGLKAVDGVTLDVKPGRSIGIVGPSGCGKSTLLSLVTGLFVPSAGTVEVHGDGSGRHLLTMVFQKDTLLPWLTVEQNVKLHYRFGGDRKGLDERVRQLLEMAHLEGFARSYPYQLSGGMRRRVAFLAAVAPLPQVLLLDEPFSALDEPSRVAIHQDVYGIVRSLGITVILVTHDLAEAASLCDEVFILTARPAKVFKRYEMPFGADRDMMSLREDREFLELYGSLWRDLNEQIKVARAHAR